MRIPDDYHTHNVARQTDQPNSILAFWKEMLVLRKEREDELVSAILGSVPNESDMSRYMARSDCFGPKTNESSLTTVLTVCWWS